MQYETLLFDLDGTLIDPREGITRCVQHALSRQDIEVADRRVLEPFIGPPLKDSFRHYYAMDEAAAEQAVADYRERFAARGMYESRVYDGIQSLLAELQSSGRRLFVATAKPWVFARRIAEHFELARYFCAVYGSELDGRRTEKRELIAHILRREELRASDVLMIGDRKYDLVGARCNGVASAAAGYGYGSRDELAAEAPDFYFESVAALRRSLVGDNAPRQPHASAG